jgi:hypothetical protein
MPRRTLSDQDWKMLHDVSYRESSICYTNYSKSTINNTTTLHHDGLNGFLIDFFEDNSNNLIDLTSKCSHPCKNDSLHGSKKHFEKDSPNSHENTPIKSRSTLLRRAKLLMKRLKRLCRFNYKNRDVVLQNSVGRLS